MLFIVNPRTGHVGLRDVKEEEEREQWCGEGTHGGSPCWNPLCCLASLFFRDRASLEGNSLHPDRIRYHDQPRRSRVGITELVVLRKSKNRTYSLSWLTCYFRVKKYLLAKINDITIGKWYPMALTSRAQLTKWPLLLGLLGPSQHPAKGFPNCQYSEGEMHILRRRFHFPRNINVSANSNSFLFSIPKPSTSAMNSLSPQINPPCPVFFMALSKGSIWIKQQ